MTVQDFRLQLASGVARLRKSRVLRDSSVMITASWFSLVLALLRSALLGRILGPAGFGVVILAMTSVNFIIQFIDLQTDEALVRFMGEALVKERRNQALTFFLVALMVDGLVGLIALVIVALVVPPVLGLYPDGAQLQTIAWIFLITTPFTIMQSNFEAVFRLFKKFRQNSLIDITFNAISFLLLLVLATQGVIPVIWGFVAVAVSTFLIYVIFALRLIRQNLPDAHGENYRATLRLLMPFVFHTSFMGSLKTVAYNIDILLLGALSGSSAVSFMSLARSAVNLIALPVSPVATILYPMMNEAWAADNLKRVKYLIRRFMLFSGAIATAGLIFIFIFADLFVGVIFGEKFLPVLLLVRIMSFGVLIESIFAWVRKATLAKGKPGLVTFTGTIATVLFIPVDFLLIYYFGAVGAASAYIVDVLVMLTLNWVYVLPRLELSDILFWWRPQPAD